jgi:hypothetical protein
VIKLGVWWARVIKLNVRVDKLGAFAGKYFLLWSVFLLGVVTAAEEE